MLKILGKIRSSYGAIRKIRSNLHLHLHQRWSPRGHILKSLALKVKSLALASRPQVL